MPRVDPEKEAMKATPTTGKDALDLEAGGKTMHRRTNATLDSEDGGTRQSAHDRSSSGSEVDLAQVAPPEFSITGAFRDKSLEGIYRESELRARFSARMTRVASIFLVLGAVIVIMDVLPRKGFTALSVISFSLWWSDWLVLALALALKRYPAVPLSALEWLSAVWLSAISTNMVLFYPYRLAQMVRARDSAEAESILGGRLECEWSEADALSRGLAMIIVAGLFTPLQHVQMAWVLLVTAGAAICGAAAFPLPLTQLASGVRTITVFGLIAAIVARAHWERVRAERTQWHFRRSVVKATSAWQRSQQHQLDAELSAAEATFAQEARSKLIRVVMHDLRSPLLACKNVAQILAEGPLYAALAKEAHGESAVSTLTTCTRIMENIVSDMLDFERIDSGSLVLVPGPFYLHKLMQDAQTTFASLAQTKGVHLIFKELPEEAKELKLIGDARRLLQVISNGISNAVKFVDEGGHVRVGAVITPHAELGDSWRRVRLSVVDDGVGLTDEELETLNAPDSQFRQVGRGQLQGNGGTGLGLGIARHMVRLHGDSHLRITSAGRGRGTTFEVDLGLQVAGKDAILSPDVPMRLGGRVHPAISTEGAATTGSVLRARGGPVRSSVTKAKRAGQKAVYSQNGLDLAGMDAQPARESKGETDVEEMAMEEDTVQPGAGELGEREHKLKCLHVEDDMMLQLTIGVTLFARLGADYETAGDGAVGVRMMQAALASGSPFDAVLIDNQMPEMSGTQATREMRRLGYTGLIIGLTGDPLGSPDRSSFEASGLDVCTDKTSDGMAQIEELLQGIISRKEQQRQRGSDD
eukprot:CAMPEP_0185166790 /NCGR_PEP_ID=MMETSP1139-20130426/13196_1 /TAXON_ID=298111 /ORGANISM="Pavlova sp., Strain CCMP459" /LENGTH=812 /DNA_ID=CAMNT_0027732251 /DNA_START=1 /DNA_END=2436 /DNA_ORIENTATION=+